METVPDLFSRRQYLDAFAARLRLQVFRQFRKLPHNHEFFELVMVQSGTGEHWVCDRKFAIFPGTVFVVAPGVTHCYDNFQELCLTNLMFLPELLNFAPDEIAGLQGFPRLFAAAPDHHTPPLHLHLNSSQCHEVGTLCNRMMAEQTRRAPGCQLALRNLFQELVLFLCRCEEPRRQNNTVQNLQLGKMLQYINLHYASDLSRDEIFSAAKVSLRSGNRIFAELLSSTPMQEVFKIRLQHACEMLLADTLSIAEIAFRSGFRDSNYFSLCFHKALGQSPRDYRKQNQVRR